MEILSQLGSLIVESIPTMVLFVLLVIAYGALVRRPLERMLEERRLRTTGAVEQAQGAISAAEAETAVYEDKLRAARQQIYAEREQRLKQRHAEREQALAAARQQSHERVNAAKKEIEQSAANARAQVEQAAVELGERIVRTLLPSSAKVNEVHQ